MQPYFLPYLGYWELMNNVDVFVVYDDVKYTKQSWMNRNRYLSAAGPKYFSIPLSKASDYSVVSARKILDVFFKGGAKKTANAIINAYINSPFFADGKDILDVFNFYESNFFLFVFNSLEQVRIKLEISSRLLISSDIRIDSQLRGQDRVLAICSALGATSYVNPIGGQHLYSTSLFARYGIDLLFQDFSLHEYSQMSEDFFPKMSILDSIFFNGYSVTADMISSMNVIRNE